MHAGYLGGVWAAVKLGMGAGLVALIVGLQPVLTALWLSAQGGRCHAISASGCGLALGFGGPGAGGVAKAGGLGEIHGLNLALAVLAAGQHHRGHALPEALRRSPATCAPPMRCNWPPAFAVTLPLALLEAEGMRWNPELAGAMAWSVLALTLGGSSLLYLLIQRGAATAVTSLLYLVPPCTALLAWLLFGEPITAMTVAGMALTAFGVSLVVRAAK
jgi:drug/metabolite transporter (DMT)-like permease